MMETLFFLLLTISKKLILKSIKLKEHSKNNTHRVQAQWHLPVISVLGKWIGLEFKDSLSYKLSLDLNKRKQKSIHVFYHQVSE
jgi:hypothetical protein